LSPTTAAHVAGGLGDRVDLILDGGPTTGGIESTVLDLTTDPPRILRPGLVTPAMIGAAIGSVVGPTNSPAVGPAKSPGMMDKHYSPRARLEIAEGDGRSRVEELVRADGRVGWLTWTKTDELAGPIRINMPLDAAGYAARLYAALHDLDAAGVDRIVVAQVPNGDDWLAIRDRLRRASG
jgi:L-threonylcarbamoyladenylate synthase